MVILITGASCVGKTFISQKLLEKYKIPYFSLDHLKMGIYRSNNNCGFTPESSDNIITEKLWPIIKEIIKTNIENNQNIIIEGCYFPDSIEDIEKEYLEEIIIFCIVFSEQYIQNNLLTKIFGNRGTIECKGEDIIILNKEQYILENKNRKEKCIKNKVKYFEIYEDYEDEIKSIYHWVEEEINTKNNNARPYFA